MPEIERSSIKNTKRPSLRPLELKNKFIQQFEFFGNLEDLYMENVVAEQGLALQQLIINSRSLVMGTSNLAILIFSTCFSI